MKIINITESFVAQKASYDRFAKIQNAIISCEEKEILICLNVENRLGYTFLFLFSTLSYLSNIYDKNIKIICNEKTYKLLKKLRYLDKDSEFDSSLDVNQMLKSGIGLITEEKHIFKIVTEITSEAPVRMSPELSAIFISKAGEMYNNALEHSQGDVIGAKYFRNRKNTYCFACYDTGIGIPQKVMSVRKEISSQLEAFKWAMVSGNSTVKSGVPRGLGLGLLQSFARANDGAIRICSGNILYTYNKNSGEKYQELNNNFCGTLFEMDIIADNNRKYILK